MTASGTPEAPPAERPQDATPVVERGVEAGATGDGGGGRLRSLGTFDSLREPIFRWFFFGQMGQSGAMQLQKGGRILF